MASLPAFFDLVDPNSPDVLESNDRLIRYFG